MKKILSIQDLSCVGKCSLTVALPVLSAMGCQCTPLPTGLLSSHTAFPDPHIRPLTEDLAPICKHFQKIGAKFDVISVGYLSCPAQAQAAAQILDAFPALTVIDPVLGDNGKLYSGMDDTHVSAIRQLCRRADILLPNVTEAACLAGIPYQQTTDLSYYQQLLEGIKPLAKQGALITGVSLAPDTVGFIGWENGALFSYQAPLLPVSSHGTGDLFCAVFTGAVAEGKTLYQAGVQGADFVAQVLSSVTENSLFGLPFEEKLPLLWEKPEKNS